MKLRGEGTVVMSNVVGIICPLKWVEVGTTDLSKSFRHNWVYTKFPKEF